MKIFTYLFLLVTAFLLSLSSGYGAENLNLKIDAVSTGKPGDDITYTIIYYNAGVTRASNVEITLQLDPNVTFGTSSPAVSSVAGKLTWNKTVPGMAFLADLGAGVQTISVTVKAGVKGGTASTFAATYSPLGYYIPQGSPSTTISTYDSNRKATVLTSTLSLNPTVKITSAANPTGIILNKATLITQISSSDINDENGSIKSATNSTTAFLIQLTNTGNIYDSFNLTALNNNAKQCAGTDKSYDPLNYRILDLNGNVITNSGWLAPGANFSYFLELKSPNGTNPGRYSCYDLFATSLVSGSKSEGDYTTSIKGAPKEPMVSLSKTESKDPVQNGDDLTYTIYAYNANDGAPAANFVITDVLPVGVTYVSHSVIQNVSTITSNGYNTANRTLTVGFSSLPYGQSYAITIKVNVKVNALGAGACTGTIINTASATYTDLVSTLTAEATTAVINKPDLKITKTATVTPMPASPDGTITYTLKVENLGNCTATGVTITDTYDNVHSTDGGGNTGIKAFPIASLAPGALIPPITYNLTIKDISAFPYGTTSITNVASVNCSELEADYNNNTASASVYVEILPDLVVTKTVNAETGNILEEGKNYTYTISVVNNGELTATGVIIKDILPAGLTFVSASDGGTVLGSTVTWPSISIAPNLTFTRTVVVKATCAALGTIMNTANAKGNESDSNESDNTAQLSSTVVDATNPTIATLAAATVNADAGVCTYASSQLTPPSASDNCSVASIVATPASLSLGVNTVTWTVTDGSGLKASSTQVVTVKDTQKPIITASANISVNNSPGVCGATVTIINATATDNCSVGAPIGTRSDAKALNEVYPVGVTTITWNVTDANGNAALAKTQTVTVTDTEKPVITASANISVNNSPGVCGATITIVNATAADNCLVGAPTGTRSDGLALNAVYPIGTTTITWNVTDINGNAALAKTQTVTVNDTEKPVITASANISVNNSPGVCRATVTIVNATASDNCSVGTPTGTRSDGLLLTDLYPVGVTNITWNVTDANGNAALAKTQTVTVIDTEKPVITASANISVNNGTGVCGATVTIVNATATDNCSVGTPAGTRSDNLLLTDVYPVGVTTITWNVSDANGNAALAKTQTVTVSDTEKPVITASANISVNNGTGVCGATVTIVNATATDNCSVGTPTGTRSDGLLLTDLYPVGTTTITWNVTDANGNAALAKTQTVTVIDNEKPVIVGLPVNIVKVNDAGACGAVATWTAPTVTDNCSGSTIARTAGPASGSLFPLGTTTITYTATDASNNTTVASFTVTVTDTEKPVITASANISVNNATGVCGATVTIVNATATDNCSVGVPTGTRSDGLLLTDLYPVGTTNITWNVTDANGNAAIAKTQTVTVSDTEKPVITASANISVNNGTGVCGATVTIVNATATDNCSVGMPTGTRNDGLLLTDVYPVGVTNITWNVSDVNGNAALAKTQTVTVTDTEKPVIVGLPVNIVKVNDAGACGAVATWTAPTVTDNCSGSTIARTAGPASGSLFPLGTTTITYTATDASNNTTVASFTVTVTDTEKPVIVSLPVNIVKVNDAGACGAVATWTAPTVTDNCSGSTIAQTAGPASGSLFPLGTTTITYTATDASNNTTVASFTVTVTDTEKPVIVGLPVNIVKVNDAGACGAVATWTAPTVTDNCSGSTIAQTAGPASGSLFPLGTTTITYTATDASNNTTVASFTVTVTDTEKPVITASANISVNNGTGVCGATVTIVNATATDNCSVGVPTGTRSDGLLLTDLYPVGTTTITWNVSDANGNAALAKTQTVTVSDTEKPVITASANISVNNGTGVCGATVTIVNATATDNCSVGTPTGTRSDGLLLTDLYPVGTTTITWNVTDANGNAALAKTQTVTVIDNEKPVIVGLPVNIVKVNDAGACGAVVTWTAPTVTDNCTGSTIARTAGPASGSLFPLGTTTITYTATDASLNTTVASFTVTVNDTEKPVIVSLPVNIVKVNDAGACGAVATWTAPTVTDNCSGSTIAQTAGPASGSLFPLGTTTITYTATDASNNTTVASFTVTVTDTEKPVITASANISVNNATGVCGATVTIVNATATDNCSVGTPAGTRSDGLLLTDLYPVGTTNITWNVSDANGNAAIAKTQTVTVSDTEKPVITASANISVNNGTGVCGATVTIVNATATDNCSVGSPTGTRSDGLLLTDVYPVGVTTITWNVSDANGNAALAKTQTVTVTDNEKPVITAPTNISVNNGTGVCGATLTIVNATATDNCSVGSPTGTRSDNLLLTDVYPVGVTTVTWNVTDASGNAALAKTQTVTVTDTEKPVITASANISVNNATGVCGATVTIVNATATDNCLVGTPIGTRSDAKALNEVYPVGTTTITWNVTDANGNAALAKTQTVTVSDTEKPVITASANISVNNGTGVCGATVTIVNATATDNCSVGSPTGTRNDGLLLTDLYPVGVTTITWNVSDANGNAALAKTQTVTVKDNEKPVIAAPAAVTGTTNVACTSTNVILGTPITSDNCSVASVTNDAPAAFPVGQTNVTWTVIDNAGLMATATQTVTIIDNISPTIIAPAATTGTTNLACTSTNVVLGTPVTSDNCAVASVTNDAPAAYPIGQTIVTWTVTDAGGLKTTATQLVTVIDNINPKITAPAPATGTTNVACTSTNVVLGTPVTSDNCSVASVTNDAPAAFPLGQTTVTWTVTDKSGLKATATQLVTVTDNINPLISCITPLSSYPSDPGVCTYKVTGSSLDPLSTSDNCSVKSVLNDFNSTTTLKDAVFPIGTTKVTWTVTDGSGNKSTCSYDVVVVDTQKPTITCAIPANSYPSDNGSCTYKVIGSSLDPLSTSDNCSVKSVLNDFNSASTLKDAVFPIGTTKVTWTVTDVSGNKTTCSYDIVVVDIQKPTINCAIPAVSYPSDNGVCTYKVQGTSLDPTSVGDNCTVKSVTNDFNNSSSLKDAIFPIGSTKVTWTVEDKSGNKIACSYNVVVVDTQNPTIICATAAASYPYKIPGTNLDPTVSDNCSVASVKNDYNNTSTLKDAEFPLGTTIVTWTVTDGSGNKATCVNTIVIKDVQPPTIICASVPASFAADNGVCTYHVPGTALDPVVSDNYGGFTIVNNFNNLATLKDAKFSIGTTTVVWTVTDSSGNSATCTQVIKVTDTQNPTIACPANLNITAIAGQCTVSDITLAIPVTNDNCSVASVSNNAPKIYPLGSTVVRWTVVDASGNSTTCDQIVNINGSPLAVNDIVSMNEDTQYSGNVLTNDLGLCDVQLKTHTDPLNGRLTISADGSYIYTPTKDFYGNDQFTYQICDKDGDCSTGRVLITIANVDDLPLAANDSEPLQVDVILNGRVDLNDTWSGDGGNVWTLLDPPTQGTVQLKPDGSYTYNPNTGFIGSDSFTYQLCDTDGDCSQAKVTITIEDVLIANQILTPNGDNINDTFIIEGIDLYPDNKVTLYNRWGNVVYQKSSYLNEWDGNSNVSKVGTKSLPVGTYYYLIDYGKNRHKTGFVYLDR